MSAKPTAALTSATSPSALWVENSGAQRDELIAGLQSSSDPVDEASLKQIEALFRSRANLHLRHAWGHKGKQSQAPKQVLGVVTLHAVCEERHVVVVEPSTHVVWTGPLPTRPFP